MKKYRFRLETVRRVRRTQEELAKSALAHANGEVQRAIQAVENRMAQYEQQLPTGRLGVTGVDMFMKQRYFNELAGRAVLAARAAQAVAEDEAELRRQTWSQVATQVKSLDRLDDRRREEFQLDFDRETAKEVDDIVIAQAIRASTARAQKPVAEAPSPGGRHHISGSDPAFGGSSARRQSA